MLSSMFSHQHICVSQLNVICSDALAENLSYIKFKETEFYFPNLLAVVGFRKMLADFISHF